MSCFVEFRTSPRVATVRGVSDADLRAVGIQFQADEHADTRAAQARVDDFAAETAPAPAPLTPEQQKKQEQDAQAAQLAGLVEAQLPKLCGVAWAIVDRLVQQMTGPEMALTADEKRQLAEATVPVVTKHVPQGMDWLVKTPEGALVLTAGMIYGFKMLAAPAPASSEAQPTPEATA